MNILIVDDQPNVISSILKRIPWQGLGISNVYTANSAFEAKHTLEQKEIHILLADIEMPQENGLSLVRWIRNKGMNIECILLTSHANFYYAQIAITLEICDYVIQPAATEDIVRSLEKAKQKLLQRQQANKKMNYNGFLSSTQNTVLRNFFENLPFDPQKNPEVLTQLQELGIPESWDGQLTLVLTKLNRWTKVPPPFSDLFHEYEEVLQKTFSFIKTPVISFYVDESKIYTIIFSCDFSDLKSLLQSLQKTIFESFGCLLSLFYCSLSFSKLPIIFKDADHTAELFSKDEPQAIQPIISNQDYQHLSPSRIYEKYMEQLRKYVTSHLQEPLTREMLSRELGISPDHLSHVVYQTMGCSLKSFLTQERMRHGRELLRTTSLSIGEISNACGYESLAYFSKVYRDTYHHSPREERKNS